ncbi:MAG: PEP-CTERM sorting domain-containing protein [Isosphaeraceae bacterium]|nr:PEP-CTERM sorting domain-containing protein [Isosphaeraceae bacterium]
MSRILLGLGLLLALASSSSAGIVIDTQSLAVQTLESPLFGGAPIVIRSPGTQRFTLDLTTGQANVASSFQGNDLPDPLNPGGFLSYDLYNTPASTTGTIVLNGSGTYDLVFTLLFELAITSGPLTGQTFETMQFATFAALGVPTIPFGPGTIFTDPARPDPVVIFAKTALPGVYSVGDPLGTSTNRTVTVLQVVPEPSTLALGGLGVAVGLGRLARNRNRRDS